MRSIIWYRSSQMDEDELKSAQTFFPCIDSRMLIQPDDLVIARYSALPFYDEQEHDILTAGARMINTIKEHRFAADIRNYVEALKEMTPQTWYRIEDIPPSEKGPFFLKGKTNSRKNNWKTHAYAEDRHAAGEVFWRLCMDGLIGQDQQEIYVRKYIPLVTYMEGLNGLPITKEFRFFVAYGEVLCGAYYWQNYITDIPEVPSVGDVPQEFLEKAIRRIGRRIPFYALDVGQTQEGGWIVIEINDGQMSGLSENLPLVLYSKLRDVLDRQVDRPSVLP